MHARWSGYTASLDSHILEGRWEWWPSFMTRGLVGGREYDNLTVRHSIQRIALQDLHNRILDQMAEDLAELEEIQQGERDEAWHGIRRQANDILTQSASSSPSSAPSVEETSSTTTSSTSSPETEAPDAPVTAPTNFINEFNRIVEANLQYANIFNQPNRIYTYLTNNETTRIEGRPLQVPITFTDSRTEATED